MVIAIHQEAKDWIQAKGSHLTVKLLDIKGGCAPSVHEAVAVPDKSKMLQQFNEYHEDGLVIYVHKNQCHQEKLTLRLSGPPFLKSIAATLE